MNGTQIAILGTAGATIAGVVYLAASKRGEADGYPVEGGTIVPDSPRVQADIRDGYILDLAGNYRRIGTVDACAAAYQIAAEHSQVLGDLSVLVEQSLTAQERLALHTGYVNSNPHRYPIDHLSDEKKGMIVTMVSCAVNTGQSLRLLSFMYQAAGITSTEYRPSAVRSARIDAAHIVHGGSFLDPLGYHPDANTVRRTVWDISDARAWEQAGIIFMREWMKAYGIDPTTIQGAADLARDWDQAESRTVAGGINTGVEGGQMNGTMGVGVIGIAIALAIVAIGGAVAYAIVTGKGAELLSAFLGHNVALQREQAEAYREASECARDTSLPSEDRSACVDIMAEISESEASFTPGWSGLLKWGLIGGVGIGGTVLYVKYGHKYAKQAYGAAKTKVLAAGSKAKAKVEGYLQHQQD
jgi:hypothetical protein